MKNRRGISEVVAAVLLILLTVAAAATLISFIKPFVEKGLGDSTRCKPYTNYVEFEDKLDNGTGVYNYNCWQTNGSNYFMGISLKTGTGLNEEQISKIRGFLITLKKDSNYTNFNITNGPSRNDLWIIQNKSSDIIINNQLETVTYVYNSSTLYQKAEVLLLLDSGTCESSDSIELNPCNGVSLS